MGLTQALIERKFPRVSVGVNLSYSTLHLEKATREYLGGVASNASLGGMFIATAKPLPRGTVIGLEFNTNFDPEDEPSVRARAVVRWTRRFLFPRGMGIEFVEFEGLGKRHFQSWLKKLTDE